MFSVVTTPNQNFVMFVVLPGLFPTIQTFFFLLELNESDQKWGVTQSPSSECLREGIPRRLNCKFGKSPFFARSGLVCPGLADRSSSWLLWHDQKTTSHVETTNCPDPLKRDQHTIGLGSVTTT